MKTEQLTQLTQLAMAAAAVYVVYTLSRAHQAGSNALKPLADGIGNIWTALTQGPGVAGSFGYVVLKPRDFVGGYLTPTARQAITTMHSDNAGLLALVVNANGQINPQYQAMLSAGGLAVTKDGVTAL